jgi:hypothetical protein
MDAPFESDYAREVTQPLCDRPLHEFSLHFVECSAVDNRLMLSGIDLALIDNLANIEPVLEEMRERPDHKPGSLNRPAVRKSPRLRTHAVGFERGGQRRN